MRESSYRCASGTMLVVACAQMAVACQTLRDACEELQSIRSLQDWTYRQFGLGAQEFLGQLGDAAEAVHRALPRLRAAVARAERMVEFWWEAG